MQAQFQKFIPFAKVDAVRREVWGIATAEVLDKDGEICDYDKTKPYYKEWSEEFAKATDGKSLGNIRYMHQMDAVGKLISVDFRDQEKEIFIGGKIVDDSTWKKVEEGVLTGFSQGGTYIEGPDENGRYVAKPSEVSVVDNPCLGVAHFAYIKTDGTMELRKLKGNPDHIAIDFGGLADAGRLQRMFSKAVVDAVALAKAKTKRVAGEDLSASAFAYVGDPEDTSTWKLPIKFSDDAKTKSHIRNALARFNQTKGIPDGEKAEVKAKIEAAAKKHGIEVSEEKAAAINAEIEKLITKARANHPLLKDMWDVSRLAEVLQTLANIRLCSIYEREREGDESGIPESLLEDLESLIETFLEMAEEESKELAALSGQTNGGILYMSTQAADLLKAAKKSLADHLDKIKKALDDHHDKMTDHYEKMKKAHDDHHDKMSDHIEKMKKAFEGVEIEKPKENEEPSEEEKAKKAAAAAASANGHGASKDDIQAMIDKATAPLLEQIKELSKKPEETKVRGTLVPRPGETIATDSADGTTDAGI